MSKVRVYELAKELGVESKVVVAKLQEMGEFVRSASSTIEAPVVRRLREAFPAAPAAAKPAARKAAPKPAAPAAPEAPVVESAAVAAPAAPVPAAPVAPAAPAAPTWCVSSWSRASSSPILARASRDEVRGCTPTRPVSTSPYAGGR